MEALLLDIHTPIKLIGSQLDTINRYHFQELQYMIECHLKYDGRTVEIFDIVDKIETIINTLGLIESKYVIDEIFKVFRIHLISSNKSYALQTVILVDILAKNCGPIIHYCIENLRFIKTMYCVAKRNYGNVSFLRKALAIHAFDCIQAWGEAFLPQLTVFPNIHRIYLQLRSEYGIGFPRRDFDSDRVPLVLQSSHVKSKHRKEWMQHHSDDLISLRHRFEKETIPVHHRMKSSDAGEVELLERDATPLESELVYPSPETNRFRPGNVIQKSITLPNLPSASTVNHHPNITINVITTPHGYQIQSNLKEMLPAHNSPIQPIHHHDVQTDQRPINDPLLIHVDESYNLEYSKWRELHYPQLTPTNPLPSSHQKSPSEYHYIQTETHSVTSNLNYEVYWHETGEYLERTDPPSPKYLPTFSPPENVSPMYQIQESSLANHEVIRDSLATKQMENDLLVTFSKLKSSIEERAIHASEQDLEVMEKTGTTSSSYIDIPPRLGSKHHQVGDTVSYTPQSVSNLLCSDAVFPRIEGDSITVHNDVLQYNVIEFDASSTISSKSIHPDQPNEHDYRPKEVSDIISKVDEINNSSNSDLIRLFHSNGNESNTSNTDSLQQKEELENVEADEKELLDNKLQSKSKGNANRKKGSFMMPSSDRTVEIKFFGPQRVVTKKSGV